MHIALFLSLQLGLLAPTETTASATMLTGPAGSRSLIEHAVAMRRIHGAFGERGARLAAFAPDGRSFTVVISRGVVSQGVNEFQLCLYSLQSSGPNTGTWTEQVLLTLASPGNLPAITRVQWINPHLLGFLASPDGKEAQVHTFDLNSGRHTQRTAAPTPVISYGFSRDGTTLVYAAANLADSSVRQKERLQGILVRPTDTALTFGTSEPTGPDLELFVSRNEKLPPKLLATISTGGRNTAVSLARFGQLITVSPDGRAALVAPVYFKDVPENWGRFSAYDVRLYLDSYRISPPSYGLLDLTTGAFTPTNIPTPTASKLSAEWTSDGNQVFVTGYLTPKDPRFTEVDKALGGILSFTPASGKTSLIKVGLGQIVAISQSADSVTLVQDERSARTDEPTAHHLLRLAKKDNVWQELERVALGEVGLIHRSSDWAVSESYFVGVTQAVDTPPELVVVDLGTQTGRIITKLNPQLEELPRGEVAVIDPLRQSAGDWPAQLVKPVGYVSGHRYPAVVMFMDRFGYSNGYVLDGADYRAANPIQALANRGIAVLMVWFPYSLYPPVYGSAAERPIVRQMVDTAYERLVDELAIADPARVAVSGFSHAGWVTQYSLHHAKHPFAAAMAIDNWTASYFGYVLRSGSPSEEKFYGGASPYDREKGNAWWDDAIGFNPQRMRTPLLIEVHGSDKGWNFGGWEIYISLRRLGRPVEQVLYPAGLHIMLNVSEQISSAERQVDWFCFWLKDEEDSNPAKLEQYARWRKMKADWQETRNSEAK